MGTNGNYPSNPTKTDTPEGTTGAAVTLADCLLSEYNDGTKFSFAYGLINSETTKRTDTSYSTTILADGSRVINLYYARKQYTVTLYKGTGISSVTGAGTYYYGASVTINATVSSGYTWSKWTGYKETTTKEYTFTMPVQNVEFTANATINPYSYTVRHYLQNADGTYTQTGSDETKSGSYGSSITIANLKKTFTGYTYSYGTVNGTTATTATVPANNDMVIALYYNASTGTGYVVNHYLQKEGYIFDGFFTEKEGGGVEIIDEDGNIVVDPDYFTEDDTIYAKWVPITYYVHFDPNPPACIQGTCDYGCICSCSGGSCCTAPGACNGCDCTLNYTGTMADMTFTYDVAQRLTANAFYVLSSTAQRYTFVGWNTEPDGSGTSYTNRQSVKNLTNVDGATVTLYAQWTPKTYTITCNQASGSGGTSQFYEVFNTKFYTNTTTKEATVTITVPTRAGYVFGGYYTSANGAGDMIVDAGGTIAVGSTYFTANKTIYAYWLKLDMSVTEVIIKDEKDDDAAGLSATELKNVRWKTTLYVYHTYKNNSTEGTYYYGSYVNGVYVKGEAHDLTCEVSGYYSSTGKVGDYTLAPQESVTVFARSTTPAIGGRSQSAYAYLKAWGYGKTSGTWDNCHSTHSSSTISESSSSNNSAKVSYTVNFDIELVEIYLADKNGVRLSEEWIKTGMKVYVHHVYRNNSTGAVYTDRYSNNVQFASNVYMAAGATHDVVAGSFTATTAGVTWTETGAIFRTGYADEDLIGTLTDVAGNALTLTKEAYETYEATNKEALDNNVKSTTRNVISPLTIELITPDKNTDLRAGTDVFATFRITNSNTATAFPIGDMIRVVFEVYNSKGTLVTTMTQDTVIPAAETQLVWCRWTVPSTGGTYTIKSTLSSVKYPVTFDTSSDNRKVYVSAHEETEDTRYVETQPGGWTRPRKPSAITDSVTWYQWSYNSNTKKFVKNQYGLNATAATATITPNSETAYFKDGCWYTKSGYGFGLEVNAPTVSAVKSAGYTAPDATWYTNAQWAYTLFPEFMYDTDERTTLELNFGIWEFRQFMDYGRLHFVPIWYPDNQYVADC